VSENQQTGADLTLVYGPSNSRKTTQMGEAALYVLEKTGGNCRYISAENAGQRVIMPYIEERLIQPLWLHKAMHPIASLRRIMNGMWPQMKDSAGKPTLDPDESDPLKMGWRATTEEEWTSLGGYIFEGITSLTQQALGDVRDKQSKLNFTDDGKSGITGSGFMDDGLIIGVPSQGQYNTVQQEMLQHLREGPKVLYDLSKRHVKYIFWTAHEATGPEDGSTGRGVYGPAAVGKAITGKIPSECGTMLHFQPTTLRQKVKEGGAEVTRERVTVLAHFQNHPDPNGNSNIIWPAKPRYPAVQSALEKILEMLKQKWPSGCFELKVGQSLRDYLKFQDTLQPLAREELRADMVRIRKMRDENVPKPS
jgi:hypothetical protein